MRAALRRNRAVAMVREACHVEGSGREGNMVDLV